MRRFPKWKFALISICDTLAGLLILIPARHVSGDLLTLLIQGTVPATLLFSVTILKKRYVPVPPLTFVAMHGVAPLCPPWVLHRGTVPRGE